MTSDIQGVQKKGPLRMIRKGWFLFFKTVFEVKTTTYIHIINQNTLVYTLSHFLIVFLLRLA